MPYRATVLIVIVLTLGSAHAQSQPGSRGPIGRLDGEGAALPLDNDVQAHIDRLRMLPLYFRSSNPRQKTQTAPGMISVLDVRAPGKAKKECERADRLLGKGKPAEAAEHYRKAIAIYPPFVAAHNNLGVIYRQQGDNVRARDQFAAAAAQNPRLAAPFLNLGRVALLLNDYATAESAVKSARDVDPLNPEILTLLAFAQYRNRHYQDALATVRTLHSGEHKQFAVGHVVAAGALLSMGQVAGVEAEYRTFLQEDPSNASAASAREVLAQIEEGKSQRRQPDPPEAIEAGAVVLPPPGTHECSECTAPAPDSDLLASAARPRQAAFAAPARSGWVFKATVDEVRVLFTADDDGRPVTDLTRDDITVADDRTAPREIVDFRQEAGLPLRMGLLIDASNSLHNRFDFEKRAATRFLASVMVGPADVGFAGGFANHVRITQDLTGDVDALAQGTLRLRLGGGTAVWDAIYLGCRKLAGGERDPVARVLVVMTDGDDNNSRVTPEEAVAAAERAGVMVYIVSTNMLARKSRADYLLQRVAEQTGGAALFPGGMNDLDHAFAKLRDRIRSRYSIAYRPADFVRDGRYRTISIAARRAGKTLNVHARKGYWARED